MLGSHLLLAVAAWALAGAGWRVAGTVGGTPVERFAAAVVVAGALGVAEALALGRVSLAGSPAALTAAALVTRVLAARLVPVGPGAPWWRTLSRGERTALGAAVGALAALTAWMLEHPAMGIDGVFYHLPEIVGWVQRGDTGATPMVSADFPTGSYPLTNEVALAWGMGIAHAFTPVALWMALAVLLLGASCWALLRRLGCGRGLAALGVAAVLALPLLAQQLNTPKNDVPSLAFLAACAALCAVRRPAALGVAVLAAGLAVGSKTTTLPPAAIVLVAGLVALRPAGRRLLRPLALGLAGAAAVGGVWYLRNAIAHGSPLWPFGPAIGDPEPETLRRIHVSFLERPGDTLDGRTGLYLGALAGGVVLLAGGVLAPVLSCGRVVGVAAAATLVALLAWIVAPFTGRADDPVLDLSATTVRYLLPAMAAGAVALALAGRTSRLARVALVAAVGWSAVRTAGLGFPDRPSEGTLVAGALAGALAARLTGRLLLRPVLALAAVAAVVGTAHQGSGWLKRHVGSGSPAAGVEAIFAADPRWSQRDEPVAFTPQVVGTLAGDRLRHPVTFVGADEPCAAVLARARRGYVAVRRDAFARLRVPATAPGCLAGVRPLARAGEWSVYGPPR